MDYFKSTYLTKKNLPLRGSVMLNTLKPKWSWTGVKKQDGFLVASGKLMKDGQSVIV